jgi:hypothetical protein
MAEQDLTYQPDFTGIRRGLDHFHSITKYPLEVKLANGTYKTFDSYREFHRFINQACGHYMKTSKKHDSVI